MIKLIRGNVLRADAEALVNTVNCVGFMGKGVALQFKKAFPENFKAYQRACRLKEVRPGCMFIHETGMIVNPKYIINFPTKRHWQGKSCIEDIRSGLRALVSDVRRLGIKSIALPPLGTGLGGLEWRVVRPIIENALRELGDVNVLLFEPVGAPEAETMPIGTRRPRMTVARALLIKLMATYSELSYRLTLLEVQKLAYLLQEAGQPLRLAYGAGHYGPYATNLNKVLEVMEGHFTSGYGDSPKPDVEIRLLPGAIESVVGYLAGQPDAMDRLNHVSEVIEGFETPYGMELLSSVHWVAKHGEPRATDIDSAIQHIRNWSSRKRAMFKPDHIRVAWDRLTERGWLN